MDSVVVPDASGSGEEAARLRPARVGVIGLGHVGLPLAAAFATHGARVTGFDIDPRQRARAVGELGGIGVGDDRFAAVAEPSALSGCEAFVIAVPTPALLGRPELRFVEAACGMVGTVLRPGNLVVLESTYAPGTTRGVCRSILESASGLTAGRDFSLAYSPERINPGDSEHTLESVVKVVAGIDERSVRAAIELYEPIARVHRAPSLEVAELAKLVENTQRDVNIALMNEIAELSAALGVEVAEVLAAARTKWNFVDFRPGLVGGHCIAEDPYYLLAGAEQSGVELPTVASARRTNLARADRIAALVVEHASADAGPVLVYGATYKPNVADARNSGARQLSAALGQRGYRTIVVDPLVDGPERYRSRVDAIAACPCGVAIATVIHDEWAGTASGDLLSMVRPGGRVIDLTGHLSKLELRGVSLSRP